MNLCKYKDIFGKPKEGVHSYRIFDIAIVDLLLTLIGGYLIYKYYAYKYVSLSLTIFIFFILGIVMHKLFCVNTTINSLLFN